MAKFTKEDVTLIKKESLYDGFFKLNRYLFTHKLFDGGQSKVVSREVFERGHAAAVLPYDPERDELVLLEQVRFPAIETNDNCWLIEVVAGIIDPGESIEDVCHREAAEEAGIELQNLTPICSYLTSPGGTTERIYLYIAQVDASTAKGIHGLEHEAEDIRVFRLGLDEAEKWLEQGKIDNSTAIIALQWLLLNKAKIRQAWKIKAEL
jgi:ADP-ribose pyrophosphatase